MLLRLLRRSLPPRRLLRPLCRSFSGPQSSTETSQSLTIPHHPSPPPPLQKPLPLPSKSRRFYFLAGTLASIAAFAALLLSSSESHRPEPDKIYGELEQSIERSKHSLHRVLDHMWKTAAAASVLWRSLSSVLSSANHEVRSGFELRVAALLADITAAGSARRSSIVGAGSGAVVDWLLDSVAHSGGDRCGIQAESARALANLIADPNVCKTVLGRPHAVPNLLRFIFSSQPKRLKKKFNYSSLDGPNISKGKSMLVAALMDIITSNCDEINHSSFRSSLPGDADLGDIAAAIEVVEEGGIHFDDHDGNEDDDNGETGIQGIGIKIMGGTTVLGLSRESRLLKLENTDTYHLKSDANLSKNVATQESIVGSPKTGNLTVAAPGLWDDLQREHVAVPFAAWALANWALASNHNRSHIQELDSDGHAIMTALIAPERTVKWHGILVARALLVDPKLPLTASVQDWSSSLLSTATQASKVGDIPLAQLALSTFLISVERSSDAKVFLMENGLHLLRQIAKQTEKNKDLQEAIARLLELLYSGDMHLSLKESQKWSGILLRWVFGKLSSDTARGSATKILSCILEDYGPDTIPISQGWLSILLTEILGVSKASTVKGSSPLKTDKVKTQIDHSNALSAAQVSNQLASAVIKQAGNHLGSEPDSSDTYPLGDFLSIEPFSTLLKNMNKSNISKISAAESAMTTLKGIKALTEICAQDVTYQNKIADFGVLCLLRRFLLGDDYETLAANETYDASRVLETQDRSSTPSATSDSNDPSSVRVPPSAHIRRHAARLLMILSLLPKTKKAIVEDEIWCKWLGNCANGSIPCCNDPKIQSYARATLLNIFCSDQSDLETVNHKRDATGGNIKNNCPRYEDMVFLINPELPHWNCSDKIYSEDPENPSTAFKSFSSDDSKHPNGNEYTDSRNNAMSVPEHSSNTGFQAEAPLLDVVFIHGLRGGPFKSWRITDNKSSTTTKAGLVEKIDQEAGKQGTFWPREWLAADFPRARLFTVKYKTNLTQWSGASLPLQEVSSMLLQKLIAASIGDRPVIFVTHSMGGLVVKQMLYQAKINNFNNLVNNTIGVVFFSCPHFGSKLADMPWRMGLVFRPAPSIGELRSGSERLVELNDFLRHLHNKGLLEVLSFSETQVTPIVEGYGGWAFRMEVVPIESAYPGFGELVVLDGTDHINSCKPVNRTDPSYAETLEFLKKLEARIA